MKKIKNLFLSILLLCTTQSFSQVTIGEFTILEQNHEFKATEPNEKGEYDLWIYALSLDATVSKGGINIKYKKIQEFVTSLREAKNKYNEWTTTAKENSVTDLSKKLDIKLPKVCGFFYYGDINFDFNVKPYFLYTISEKASITSYSLIMYTGKLQASDNQYIDSDSFVFAFYSEEEIDEFINLFDRKLVDEKFSDKKGKEDLFK